MFKIFKSKTASNLTTEISENPNILFETTIPGNQLSFFGIRLSDKIEKISIANIKTTSMERIPAIASSSSYHDGKVFYIVDDKEIEFELQDRIKSVFENNGWLHMDTGAKYRVRDKIIVEFALHDKLLQPYKQIKKGNIEHKFGKADKVKETYEEYDGTLFYTDYIYFDRQLRVHFQDWDKEISGINIGETLIDYS